MNRYPICTMQLDESTLRYLWIAPYCYMKKTLDVGCKRGFGAKVLSLFTEELTITDITDLAKKDNPNFIQLDFTKDIPFDDEFDTVLCMEVLEHVLEPEKIINNCIKSLKKDGTFVFSTPCVDRQTDKHLKPFYTEDEIRFLLDGKVKLEYLFKHLGLSWMGVCRK
jgi:2-polyprenyl-3-methyl-5-hydroxy-6-metoxy-1,4-benzoquinol methylase